MALGVAGEVPSLQDIHSALAQGDLQKAHAMASRFLQHHGSSCSMGEKVAAALIHGSISLQLGEHADAVCSFELALAHDPANWRIEINLALALHQLEKWVEAAAHARRATELQPAVVAAHVLLAQSLRMAGELKAALAAAREAYRLDTSHVPQPAEAAHLKHEAPWLVVGEVLVDMDELIEAWQLAVDAAKVAECEPDGDRNNSDIVGESTMAKACLLAARVHEAAGQHEKALDAYAKASHLYARGRGSALRVRIITKTLRSSLPAKPGDTFIATFPKSGTTWMQLIVCMLRGEAADVDIHTKAPYIEAALAAQAFSMAQLRALPSPRTFKTHAPWEGLPVAGCTADAPPPDAKVIVVVRDPRDVMASLYYHSRSIKGISYQGSWDEWFEAFVSGTAPLPMVALAADGGGEGSSADWFAHTLGWWRASRAAPSQVLWMRYEDLLASPLEQVKRVAAFITPERQHDVALLERVVAATRFDEMKERHEASHGDTLRNRGAAAHFRRGVSGDGRAHMSASQSRRFEQLIRERLKGSGGLEDAFRQSDFLFH